MAEKNFAITPSVSISRSKFLRTNTHKTSFNLGDIVPIYCDEVLPGDTRSIDVSSLVRMSTPIAPIMDDIEMELFAFFVPNRIVWNHWKQFMGESPAAGYSAWSGTFPFCSLKTASDASVGPNDLRSYFGIGVPQFSTDTKVSALPLRGYLAIYNRWFRDQNVEAPCYIDDSDGLDSSTDSSGVGFTYEHEPLIAYKKSDYFTRALPYAQKGAPITIPLGTVAPIIGASTNHAIGTAGIKLMQGPTQPLTGTVFADSSGTMKVNSTTSSGTAVSYTNLVADLSAATSATINQLRQSFQLQKLLEKDALYGTRYWEILYGHFQVRSPDATLQDPEYLGGARFMINIDQVLSTAGYSAGNTTTVGAPGANSVTGNKSALFTKSFVEHGHIFILAVARQSHHTYGQGVMPMWRRFDRYDYYWPEFANLGAQEISNEELVFIGDRNYASTFGYQEAWADYRYKPSQVSGILAPWWTNSLNFWTLADNYNMAPTLSTSFLKETRANLSRALVTGNTGPDFIADFYFRDTAVRPLPLYSIPGLIDHH